MWRNCRAGKKRVPGAIDDGFLCDPVISLSTASAVPNNRHFANSISSTHVTCGLWATAMRGMVRGQGGDDLFHSIFLFHVFVC